ncbi:MAG TPA: response regulator [Spirochaetia bacterium]|nr:response regulator [Spirochaetia bacterium]
MSSSAILVIADDPINRKILRELLTFGRYRALEATDPETGLQVARDAQPDCILLDLALPGLDIPSSARNLKAAARRAPLIAVTGREMTGDQRKALDADFDGFVTRPIDTRTFLGILGQLSRRAQSRGPEEGEEQPTARPRVHIGEGDPAEMSRLARVLRMEGYDVSGAPEGESLLEMAILTTPDLLLVDAGLPGLDGFEVTRRLKSNRSTLHVPIVLASAGHSGDHWARALEAGADEFLSKPVNPAELLALTRSMIRTKRSGERLASPAMPGDLTASISAMEPVSEPTPPVVAILGPRREDVEVLERDLADRGSRVLWARSQEEAFSLASSRSVDVIVLRPEECSPQTLAVCRSVKQREQSIQLIVLCTGKDPGSRVAALEAGADDCLPVPYDRTELSARVALLARRKARLDALQDRCRSALNAAASDPLTGLHNSTSFQWLLDMEIKRALRHSHPVSLILLDVDDLRKVNDRLGHLVGDLLLTELAQVLKESGRETDLIARYTGDEFALALPHTGFDGACLLAERLRRSICANPFLQGRLNAGEVTVSLGVAAIPTDAATFEDLLRTADERLCRAKRGGKNRACVEAEPSPAEEPSLADVTV